MRAEEALSSIFRMTGSQLETERFVTACTPYLGLGIRGMTGDTEGL